jgi:hypothetical protein
MSENDVVTTPEVVAGKTDELATMSDGLLKFRVKRGEQETVHEIDLLMLKLTCQQCEEDHQLKTTDDQRMIPTPAFLKDLATQLDGLGLSPCTPSMAWQAWIESTNAMGRLKN